MTSIAQTPWCQITIAATKSQHVLTKQHCMVATPMNSNEQSQTGFSKALDVSLLRSRDF